MKTIKTMLNNIINKIAKTEDFEFTVENEISEEIKAAETLTVLQAMYFA